LIPAPRFSLLCQTDHSGREERIARQVALTDDLQVLAARLEEIDQYAVDLVKGACLPVGNVKFLRRAMALAGITEPPNLSYPQVLHPYLHRKVSLMPAGSVIGRWFIKPVTTKAFTGFVVDTRDNPDHLSAHDRAQYNAFLALPPETTVWVCEPVIWQSEVRYYVVDGEILGEGRYDEGSDDALAPDRTVAREMAKRFAATEGSPAACALDIGVLEGGTTALVEVNDAWALGFYSGTLDHRGYLEMLWRRWQQMLSARR